MMAVRKKCKFKVLDLWSFGRLYKFVKTISDNDALSLEQIQQKCCANFIWIFTNESTLCDVVGSIKILKFRFFVLIDIMVGESVAYDILGILIAHTFYFLSEIFPKLSSFKGVEPLKTPRVL